MLSFEVVTRQVVSAYSRISKYKDMIWSLEEVKAFFKLFYSYHDRHCRYAHPFLKNETIEWVILRLDYDDSGMEYMLNDYEYMIPQYFKTKFKNCDYSIVHFMSGDIRLMRYYEVQFLIDDLELLCKFCHQKAHQKENLNENEVKDMNNEKSNFEFNIVKNIGTITPGATNYYRKDLTLTSWRGKPAVYDLRTWKILEDGTVAPFKGLTLTIDEMRELAAVLNKFFADYAEEIKRETVRSSANLDGFLGYVGE